MSARAPFIPRPASRIDAQATNIPQSQSEPHGAGHEVFRSNGLLPASPDAQHAGQHASLNGSEPKFKPLNLSGLSRAKNGSQPPSTVRHNKSRPSLDGSGVPKPFSPAQSNHLVAPRSTSPFFPNSGVVSMNAFRQPAPPVQAHQQPVKDDLSSNKAHIVSSGGDFGPGNENILQPNHVSAHPSTDSFRYMDGSLSAHRARTASHPSLESIHEVEEEDDIGSPRKISIGPPQHGVQDNYSGNFPGDFVDPTHGDPHYPHGLRRSAKRLERTVEDGDEFEYGAGAKRYKMGEHQDEYAFGGRVTPARYPSEFVERMATPAQASSLLPPNETHKVPGDDGSKQALYRLLGQDLDICVETHADAYDQARKKWSECSVEEWTKGADELAVRFAKLLDLVKDHMTVKLALYASLHTTLSEHRTVLSDRERTLNEAKESLLREGGAVVGGVPKEGGEANDN